MKQEMKKLTTLNDIVVDVTEWQPTADGRGGKSVKVAIRKGSVVITVDEQKLRQWAERAMASKNGKTSLAYGMLRAERVNAVRISTRSA